MVFAETLANERSLDSRFIRIRNEKVARFTQLTFGHSLTSGKHNDAVIRALEVSSNQQMQRAATALKQAFWGEEETPQGTFTDKAHQVTKRKAGDAGGCVDGSLAKFEREAACANSCCAKNADARDGLAFWWFVSFGGFPPYIMVIQPRSNCCLNRLFALYIYA
mgnify:FL=1